MDSEEETINSRIGLIDYRKLITRENEQFKKIACIKLDEFRSTTNKLTTSSIGQSFVVEEETSVEINSILKRLEK